jgi:hypothetical protein
MERIMSEGTLNRQVGIPSFLEELNGEKVRRTQRDGGTVYALFDVLAAVGGSRRPDQDWEELRAAEPRLNRLACPTEFVDPAGRTATLPGAKLGGLARILQSMPTPQGERVRHWLAALAAQAVAEQENPELAVIRARRQYRRRGYGRRWIDQRIRAVSARQELVSEWRARGASESEDYRTLTNELIRAAFGTDVEGLRQRYNARGNESVRDRMNDLDLALLTLAEVTAAAVHRGHDTSGLPDLHADVKTAGEIVGKAREAIERQTVKKSEAAA